MERLRKLDVYPKINEDFFTRTTAGGFITLTSSVLMLMLFVAEARLFLRPHVENVLMVDTSRGAKLQINLDVTIHNLGCASISLDAMDVSGDNHLDVVTNIFKRRLDADGLPKQVSGDKGGLGGEKLELVLNNHGVLQNTSDAGFCGSCYGAEADPEDCCNSCDAVRDAYRAKGWSFGNPDDIGQCKNDRFLDKLAEQEGEGCNIYGYLEVNKVAGNFHLAPGKSFQQGAMHVHDLIPFKDMDFNISHTIHKLTFGADFPGVQNPMDGVVRVMGAADGVGMYQYFIKVVPTVYNARGRQIDTNQFSVTEHFKKNEGPVGRSLPGIFFFYDLSPIKVHFTERRQSLLQFVTSVCAIVGGVFTVSGLVDALVFQGQKVIKKKMELGKFG